MFDHALDFIGKKLSQGLSSAEGGLEDAVHAVGHLFSGGSSSGPINTQNSQGSPLSSGQSLNLNLNNSNPLAAAQNQAKSQAAQASQPGQNQTQPNPLKLNLSRPAPPPPAPGLLKPTLFNNIKTTPLPGASGVPQGPPSAAPEGHYLENAVVKPVTNIVAGDVVEPARALLAAHTGNQGAEQAANQRGYQDIQNSLPIQLAKGVINFGKAAYYVPPTISAELQNKPIPNNDATKGLSALNQSYLGGALTGPESVITHNIKGAGADAGKAGFNPDASIGSVAAKTIAGIPQAAYPLAGASKLLKGFGADASAAAKTTEVPKIADPDIAKAADQVKATPAEVVKPAKPQSDQESLFSTQERATAPDGEPPPSPYLLRKGIGVTKDMITEDDKRVASYSSSTPEQIAGQRIVNMRNTDAEMKAQNVLRNGGTRDEAVKAYRDNHPGITKKDALFRVSRMAKESKLALRPNGRSINPEEGQHDLPAARPGDYEQPAINKARIEGTTDSLLKRATDSLGALTDNDRANFVDYLEGTKPLEKADEAGKVQQAIEDSTKLTDTGNEFDKQVGGQTPHIDKYFPGYIDRVDPEQLAKDQLQAEQDLEEEVGPKEWNNMSLDKRREMVANRLGEQSQDQPREVDENYGGYKNQKRTFANRAERQAADVKDLYDDPRDALTRYANGLKFKVGGQAFKKAALEADEANFSDKGVGGNVQYGRGIRDNVVLSKKGSKALKSSDIGANDRNPVAKVNTAVKKSLIRLGVPHAVIIPPRYLGARLALETPDMKGLITGSKDVTKVDLDKPIASDNVEFGHQIDSPLHGSRYNAGVGKSGTSTLAKLNPLTWPTRAVYNWLLPTMHDSLLSAAKDYMDARGIDYNSPKAREIGHQINDVMGYSKNNDNAFGQITFAPALIKSTANMYRRSVLPNGTVARGGVLGQQMANQALGFISKGISNQISQSQGQPQNKSKDNFWSTVIHTELGKPIYTPFRHNGEQVDLGIPGQYQSDVLRVPFNMRRGSDGQLHVGINTPQQALSNAIQTGKNVLSPVASAGLSAITNQTYNGTRIRNPYDSFGQQVAQTAVNTAGNVLPINLQGFVNQKTQQHLPDWLKGSLQVNNNAPTPLRVAGNTLGMNPSLDATTGGGPNNQRYFEKNTKVTDILASGRLSQLDPSLKDVSSAEAQQWLNKWNALHPTNQTDATGVKFPQQYDAASSEGKYDNLTMTDSNGKRVLSPIFYAEKAVNGVTPSYPQSPLYKLSGSGTNVDGNTAPQALVALEYQNLQDPAAKAVLMDANGGQRGWLAGYETNVSDYSKNYQQNVTNYLKGEGYSDQDVNTYWKNHPSMPDPIDQINFNPITTNLLNQYHALTAMGDTTNAAKLLSANADVLGPAFDQLAQHANALRSAKGELQLQGYPAESPNVKALLASMPQGSDKASKTARFHIINDNPEVSQYLADVSLYETLDKGARFRYKNPTNAITMNATEGQNINNGGSAGQTFLKDVSSLGAYDVGKNAAGQYQFLGGGGTGSFSPGFQSASGASSSKFKSGSSHKIIPLPKRQKVHTVKLRRAPRQRTRVKLAKSQRRLNVKPTATIQPVNVTKPTGVVKIAG